MEYKPVVGLITTISAYLVLASWAIWRSSLIRIQRQCTPLRLWCGVYLKRPSRQRMVWLLMLLCSKTISTRASASSTWTMLCILNFALYFQRYFNTYILTILYIYTDFPVCLMYPMDSHVLISSSLLYLDIWFGWPHLWQGLDFEDLPGHLKAVCSKPSWLCWRENHLYRQKVAALSAFKN